MTRGLNHLEFDLQSASFDGIQTQVGIVIGASLEMVPVLEARQGDGSWRTVPSGGEIELPGTQTSALRYRIMNTGDIPFRAPGLCQNGGTVWPYQQLLCTLRTPRPVYALAGDYRVPIRLEDPVGGWRVVPARGQRRRAGRPLPADAAPMTARHAAEPSQRDPGQASRASRPRSGSRCRRSCSSGCGSRIIGLAVLAVSLLAAILIDRAARHSTCRSSASASRSSAPPRSRPTSRGRASCASAPCSGSRCSRRS